MNVNSFWFQFLSFEDEIFKHSQKMWQSTYILFLTSYQNRLIIILTELIVADKGRITPYKQQKCVAFKLNPIMLHNRHLTVKWGVWLTCRSCISTQLVEGGGAYSVAEHSIPAAPHKTFKWPCMMSLKRAGPWHSLVDYWQVMVGWSVMESGWSDPC